MATAQGRCVGDVGGQGVQGEGRAVRARCVPGQDCDLYPGLPSQEGPGQHEFFILYLNPHTSGVDSTRTDARTLTPSLCFCTKPQTLPAPPRPRLPR